MHTAWCKVNTPHNGIFYNKMWALHHAEYIPHCENYKTHNEKYTIDNGTCVPNEKIYKRHSLHN